MCGPQGWSGQARKISPPPRFDPRTVQPVASPYTDSATRPTRGQYVLPNFLFLLPLKIFVFILLSFTIILCLKGFFHTFLEACFILSRTPCAGFNMPTCLQIAGNSIPYTAEGHHPFPVQPVTVKPAVFAFTAENEHITGNITRPPPSPVPLDITRSSN
jgi:hypothetical protein